LVNRAAAAAGSFLFFWIAPATVAGGVPWAITRWRMRPPLLGLEAGRWLGAVLVLAGAAVVIECFARFAAKGRGTPAPVAPTEHLVVSGLYRHVRNPMYVGVLATVLGQALLLGDRGLLVYAAALWIAFTAFVMLYEEPSLQDRFGDEYARYRAGVGRWWPRLEPWRPAPSRE
jgi:protein-S-isoprenylcysteine O-methyltransferase Ste14